MGKYVLGLEIGDTTIKLVECKKHKGQVIITKTRTIWPSDGAICDGVICHIDQVCQEIQREIQQNNYRAKHIVAVIKSSQIITRNIKMDLMPTQDLEAILALQYQEHLHVNIDHYQVRYKKIERIWEGPRQDQDLLIMGVPNAIIDPLIQLARQLKMKVKSINIASDAIANLFIKEENTIVIDIGSSMTDLTMIAAGYGILNRTIPYGSKSADPLFIGRLESEVERLMQYYKSKNCDSQIETLHIIGKASGCDYLVEELTSRLGLLCKLGIELNGARLQRTEEIEDQNQCLVNVLGQLGQHWSKEINPTNMLPVQYKRSFKRKWYMAGAIGTIALVIGVLSSLAYMPLKQIIALENQERYLEAKLNQEGLTKVRQMIEETRQAQEEKDQIKATLDGISTPSHISKNTMDIMISNAPGQITINTIIMDRLLNTIVISGTGKDVTTVAQYMMRLYNTEQFKEITYTTNQDSQMGTAYTIEIQLKPLDERVEMVVEEIEMEAKGGEDNW